MIQLVEKKSRAQRLKEVSKLAEGDPAKLLQFINEEVKLAYLAGYYKFNGLTHDVEKIHENTAFVDSWSTTTLDDHEVGPDSLLPSLYSQSKGFE
jgi:hypothetical protein